MDNVPVTDNLSVMIPQILLGRIDEISFVGILGHFCQI